MFIICSPSLCLPLLHPSPLSFSICSPHTTAIPHSPRGQPFSSSPDLLRCVPRFLSPDPSGLLGTCCAPDWILFRCDTNVSTFILAQLLHQRICKYGFAQTCQWENIHTCKDTVCRRCAHMQIKRGFFLFAFHPQASCLSLHCRLLNKWKNALQKSSENFQYVSF